MQPVIVFAKKSPSIFCSNHVCTDSDIEFLRTIGGAMKHLEDGKLFDVVTHLSTENIWKMINLDFQISHLNSELVFEEQSFVRKSDVLTFIAGLMKATLPDIGRLVVGKVGTNEVVMQPIIIANCVFKDGVATLNIYTDGCVFESLWTIDTRRWKQIPLIRKDYQTAAHSTTTLSIEKELALLGASAAQTVEQFRSADKFV